MMSTERSITNPKDSIVVLFFFLALALAFSARATLSLVMPVWVREFGWSKSFISGTGAAALIVMACVAPFAGRLVDRYGPRFTLALGLSAVGIGASIIAIGSSAASFVFGFSVVSAIGFGIVATHVVSTGVARLFNANRGLAIGVATSGATAGQFLLVPLIAYVLSQTSWRWCFVALAASSLLLVPVLWRLIDEPVQAPSRATRRTTTSNLRADASYLLRQPSFHALFWSFMLCGYTTTGIIETHLIPYASFCGFLPLPSATAYGVLSMINLAGMIIAGWLTDRMHRPVLLAGIYALRAVTFIILMNIGANYQTLLLFAIVFGAVDYATVPVTASLAAEYFGIDRMGLAMGLISAGHAVGGALGAFLGGYLFDTTASYTMIWWSGVAISIAATFIVFPLNGKRAANRLSSLS